MHVQLIRISVYIYSPPQLLLLEHLLISTEIFVMCLLILVLICWVVLKFCCIASAVTVAINRRKYFNNFKHKR